MLATKHLSIYLSQLFTTVQYAKLITFRYQEYNPTVIMTSL